jgi:hypothetical protein
MEAPVAESNRKSRTTIDDFPIAKIRRDRDVQIRESLDADALKDYTDRILAGESPPAVELFYDGTDYWLSNGFHRVEAMLRAERTHISVEQTAGTRRDAILHGLGANADNGVRLTNEDKRRSVKRLLCDEEWSKWSDRQIARQVHVSNNFVSELRRLASSDDSDRSSEQRLYVDRHGHKGTMKTGAIGRSPRLRAARDEDKSPTPSPSIAPEAELGQEDVEPDSAVVPGDVPSASEPVTIAPPADAPSADEPGPGEAEVAIEDVAPSEAAAVTVAPAVSGATPERKAAGRKQADVVPPADEPSRQALAGKVRRYRNVNKDVQKALKEALKLIDGKAAMQIRFVEVQVFLRNALKRLKEVE